MAQSPYAQVGPGLVQLGYSAIPIFPGSKAPGHFSFGRWSKMEQWTLLCDRLPNEGQVEEWVKWPGAGVGVCLGAASGLVAIDFDMRPELWPRLEALIPKSPVVKRGEKGYTAFFRFSGEQSQSWKNTEGQGNIVELLAKGRQTIIPPTIHPTTRRPYAWDGESLLDYISDDLPALPEHVGAMFSDALGLRWFTRESSPVPDFDCPSVEWIRDMLTSFGPEMDAETWSAIGASIKSVYPGEDGFRLWDEWSARDTRKGEYRPKAMPRRWESLNKQNKVTIGTLFYHANLAGYENWSFDQDRQLEGVSAELDTPESVPALPVVTETVEPGVQVDIVVDAGASELIPATPAESKAQAAIPLDIVLRAPGLVGKIARWITRTAPYPQPVLSLGIALATVGALKGHIYRTETNLRTNLYILGLGGSGSGKNHPLEAIRFLLSCSEARQLSAKRPGSRPGVYQTIANAGGRCVILWDEIGKAISEMSRPDAPSHYSQIMTAFTEAFSAAGSVLEGEQLAMGGRSTLAQPCLCIYGATVSSRFFENLSHEEVVDGFLARWLVFEVEDNWPEENEEASLFGEMVPLDLIDEIDAIEARKPGWNEDMGLRDVDPAVVPFTPAAKQIMKESKRYFRELAKQAELTGGKTTPIWVRAAEHAAKVALTVSDGERIEEAELIWALQLVECQCRNMVRLIDTKISRNNQEKNTKWVLDIIRSGGTEGVTRTRLTKETYSLRKAERDEIIKTLLDSEQIANVMPSETKNKGRPPVAYRVI